jgi:hypothetical protein
MSYELKAMEYRLSAAIVWVGAIILLVASKTLGPVSGIVGFLLLVLTISLYCKAAQIADRPEVDR